MRKFSMFLLLAIAAVPVHAEPSPRSPRPTAR
jgi:hypothetical protein